MENAFHLPGRTAIYSDQDLDIYRGNPFLEALPPILSREDAAKLLEGHPHISEADRAKPAHLRIHLVENVKRAFIPLRIHEDIDERISTLLRSGYVGRNPLRDENIGRNRSVRVDS